jgi:hypothetical protein
MTQHAELEGLCRVEPSQRDGAWRNALVEALSSAPLSLCDPQIDQGPDGFPYFGVALENGEDQAMLSDILAHCTERAHCGLVLFSEIGRSEPPQWVFSLGDLWSLRMFSSVEGDPDDIAETKTEAEAPASDGNQQVLLAAPSESFLPEGMRQAICDFLKDVLGLTENPDITLVVAPDLRPSRNLMLNVEARAFRDDAQRQAVLHALGWFVPRHRGLMYWPEEWNDRTAPGRT